MAPVSELPWLHYPYVAPVVLLLFLFRVVELQECKIFSILNALSDVKC